MKKLLDQNFKSFLKASLQTRPDNISIFHFLKSTPYIHCNRKNIIVFI